jgi:F420-non-reducing hydrogenase iron-sulfur subunit
MTEPMTQEKTDEKKEEIYEPLIIGFCCNWCSYAAADLAGVSRTQYPPNIRVIRVMCSGMVHPNLVMDALTKGADGVLICGCHPGDCHYREGNLIAKKRAEAIDLMLEDYGLEPERFRLEWISASEGKKFAQVVTEMVDELKKLGPSPYKAG